MLAVCGMALFGSGCRTTLEQRVAHLRETQNLDGARAYLQQVVAEEPNDPEAWYLLAEAQVDAGDLRGADLALRHVSVLNSAKYSDRARELRAYAIASEIESARDALRSSDPHDAARRLQNVLALDSLEVDLWRAYGDALWQSQRPTEARIAYQRALSLHQPLGPDSEPERGLLLRNLAVVALEQQSYAEALGYADRLRDLPPAAGYRDQVPVFRFYAHHGLGDFEAAEAAYHRIETNDITRRIRYDRALMAYTAGQPERALRDMEILAESRDASPKIIRLLGETYYAQGNYSGMLDAYERMYRLTPGDPQVLRSLIVAHDALGHAEDVARFRDELAALGHPGTGQADSSRPDSRDDRP